MKYLVNILLLIYLNCYTSLYNEASPPTNTKLQEDLLEFKKNILFKKKDKFFSKCGIIWILSSVNGSKTDYFDLKRRSSGEGELRLLAVTHEVLVSASRVLNTLSYDVMLLPSICRNDSIQLTLFTDKDIFQHYNKPHHVIGIFEERG